tara:strand:+ start:83 stop:403 length:321 start_codon:yes stop_codon:yes gene_type:complete
MKYLKLFGVLNLLLLLLSCGLVKEGFQNPKKKSSDEFLVEKKSPLVMPPNFNELPVPKIDQNVENTDNNKIKEILDDKENKLDSNSETTEMNNTFEENLIEKIKKN